MLKRTLCPGVLVCFLSTVLTPIPIGHSQPYIESLPKPGVMVPLSSAFEPPLIKGLTIHKDNPFLFDFIVDMGQDRVAGNALKTEGEKLIKYFLASLAIPERDLWVNLSPYEKDRTMPQALSQTEMGRDLLAQDYLLKQITASLIYPEKEIGKNFWDKVYAQAQQVAGATQLPVNTFNKVWIVADKAEIFERGQTVFVVDKHLKVMLEDDYQALSKNSKGAGFRLNPQSSSVKNIVREIILPVIEKEVNTGKNFANLRQIFNSLILASWYKRNLKEALLNQAYADQAHVKGITIADKTLKEQIYKRYLDAYKRGVFNLIKDDRVAGQSVPRKYFSGGITIAHDLPLHQMTPQNFAMLGRAFGKGMEKNGVVRMHAWFNPTADAAMTVFEAIQQQLETLKTISQKADFPRSMVRPMRKMKILYGKIRSFLTTEYVKPTFAAVSQVTLELKQLLREANGIKEWPLFPADKTDVQQLKAALQELTLLFDGLDMTDSVGGQTRRIDTLVDSLVSSTRPATVSLTYLKATRQLNDLRRDIGPFAATLKKRQSVSLLKMDGWWSNLKQLSNNAWKINAHALEFSDRAMLRRIQVWLSEIESIFSNLDLRNALHRDKDAGRPQTLDGMSPRPLDSAMTSWARDTARRISSSPEAMRRLQLLSEDPLLSTLDTGFRRAFFDLPGPLYFGKDFDILFVNEADNFVFVRLKNTLTPEELESQYGVKAVALIPKEYIDHMQGIKSRQPIGRDAVVALQVVDGLMFLKDVQPYPAGLAVSAIQKMISTIAQFPMDGDIALPVKTTQAMNEPWMDMRATVTRGPQDEDKARSKQKIAEILAQAQAFLDIRKQASLFTPATAGLITTIEQQMTILKALYPDTAIAVQGGIDLTTKGMSTNLRKVGQGVQMNVDPAMVARFKREGIHELRPVIYRITPASIWPLIGLPQI